MPIELTLPIDSLGEEKETLVLKDMNEEIFVSCKMLADANKEIEATREFLRMSHISGDLNKVLGSFHALRSAMVAFAELLQPMKYELKKS